MCEKDCKRKGDKKKQTKGAKKRTGRKKEQEQNKTRQRKGITNISGPLARDPYKHMADNYLFPITHTPGKMTRDKTTAKNKNKNKQAKQKEKKKGKERNKPLKAPSFKMKARVHPAKMMGREKRTERGVKIPGAVLGTEWLCLKQPSWFHNLESGYLLCETCEKRAKTKREQCMSIITEKLTTNYNNDTHTQKEKQTPSSSRSWRFGGGRDDGTPSWPRSRLGNQATSWRWQLSKIHPFFL